jgi:hypothetical protein
MSLLIINLAWLTPELGYIIAQVLFHEETRISRKRTISKMTGGGNVERVKISLVYDRSPDPHDPMRQKSRRG